MIEFHCSGCNKEFKVPENKAGKKGKCPNCQSIIQVPFSSDNELIFDQNEMTLEDPNLQKLYDTLVNRLGNKIKQHYLPDRTSMIFDVYTDEYNTRTQFISVASIEKTNDSNGTFIILSQIGTIHTSEAAILALRAAKLLPRANVALNDDDLLSISMFLDTNLPIDVVCTYIIQIAVSADKLEELIFGWDKH